MKLFMIRYKNNGIMCFTVFFMVILLAFLPLVHLFNAEELDLTTISIIVIISIISVLLLFIALIKKDVDFFTYVIINNHTIKLKRFFRVIQSYSLSQVSVSFSVFKQNNENKPCLIFGKNLSTQSKFIENLGSQSKSKYFAVCLSSFRWKSIIKYYKKQILLLNIEDYIYSLEDETTAEKKEIEKYYKAVVVHNKEI